MKIKWGALVTDGRGKVGGHVASKNKAGAYLRTKVTPANPNTEYQSGVRARLSALSTAWRGLTEAQRTAWNDAVEQYKGTDVFGDIKNPTGFNLHQRLNNNLAQIDVAAITTPPLPEAVAGISTGVLAAANGGAITVTFTVDPVFTDCDLVADATPAISPGINNAKKEFRRIGKYSAVTTHVLTLTTEYNAKFGAVGAAGQKVFVRLKMINKTTGQAGIPVIYSAVIS